MLLNFYKTFKCKQAYLTKLKKDGFVNFFKNKHFENRDEKQCFKISSIFK